MNTHGWIEVVCGPMFAGKSEEIIRRCKRLLYANKKFLVFKPVIDDRYSLTQIVSHDKRAINSISVSSSKEIKKYLIEGLDAIVIDEVQFFDEGIVTLADELANQGIRVICAGLDMDFKGDPFPITANLLAKAEEVTKLTAICVKCGEPATRSQRLIDNKPASRSDQIVKVGGKESYEPRCRKCHIVK